MNYQSILKTFKWLIVISLILLILSVFWISFIKFLYFSFFIIAYTIFFYYNLNLKNNFLLEILLTFILSIFSLIFLITPFVLNFTQESFFFLISVLLANFNLIYLILKQSK